MEFLKDYGLAELTTIKIGGKADYFCIVHSEQELREAWAKARQAGWPIMMLGNGSNVVISDAGFQGLVIRNQIMGLEFRPDGEVLVGAGENWDEVVAASAKKRLAGIECLSGIPGSAGGGVVQNIGAYGQTLGDVVVRVQALETATGSMREFAAAECNFEYRNSLFKRQSNQYLVTQLTLCLQPNGTPHAEYPEIQKIAKERGGLNLEQLREQILAIRAKKGYLIMPGIDSYNTAGSFFKNPVVGAEKFEELKPLLGDQSLNRFWPVANGVKLAAAFLVQEAGFPKGYRTGRVGISPKHALSIVNFGGAASAEVTALAAEIKTAVAAKFGVELEEEILYIGNFN